MNRANLLYRNLSRYIHPSRIVSFENVSAAAYRIRDGIVRSPCDVRYFVYYLRIMNVLYFLLFRKLISQLWQTWTYTWKRTTCSILEASKNVEQGKNLNEIDVMYKLYRTKLFHPRPNQFQISHTKYEVVRPSLYWQCMHQ